MMLIGGFGFLMAFVRRFTFSAVGLTFICVTFVTEWTILLEGFKKIGIEQGREYESRVPCDVMIGSQSDCEMMGASLYTDESVPIPVTTGSVHHRKIQQIKLDLEVWLDVNL